MTAETDALSEAAAWIAGSIGYPIENPDARAPHAPGSLGPRECGPRGRLADEAGRTAFVCRWCPPGCKSCEPEDCECYTHQDEPDRAFPPASTTDGERQ